MTMSSVRCFALAAAALLLAAASFAQGVEPFLLERDVAGTVHEAGDIDQPAAEMLFASAEAAIYFPDTKRARWLAVGGSAEAGGVARTSAATRSLRDFRNDLERDFPGFSARSHGPYLLKMPARAAELEPAFSTQGANARPSASVLTDSFESGLAQWDLAHNTNGDYDFTMMGCAAHTGGWSADAVRGGYKGQHLFCSDSYPAGVVTQIKHKTCDAIQGASQAWLDFYLTANMDPSERLGVYYAGTDVGWGYEFSGDWKGWSHIVLNLRQWNRVGDLTLLACPKVFFQFKSDAAAAGTGPQIDDVTIRTDAPPFLSCSITATPVSGPAPLAVSFIANVAGATGSERYEWRFGDAASSTAATRNSTFTYSAAGDYWALLRVTDTNDTRGSAYVKIQVSPGSGCSVACTASVPTAATVAKVASFQATATPSGCSGSPAFLWNFGDGQTSAQQNATHAYTAAGTYSWTLTVSAGGSSCTKSGTLAVAAQVATRRRAISQPAPAPSAVSITVQPSAVTLAPGGRQTFRATVTGTTNTAVTWSVAEGAAGGTIDAQGNYTAPSTGGISHVVARSQAEPAKSASAYVFASASTIDPVYAPQSTVSGTTTTETKSVTTTPNVKNTVTLGDGTKVEIPPVAGALTVTVTRETNTLDAVRAAGQETSGAMRTVTISGDSASLDFVPTITIPAAEGGSIAALNVARVGPVAQEGSVSDKVMFLPASRDASGNIVVRDIYMRSAARLASASSGRAAPLGVIKTIRSIWTASTYQGKINWAIAPQLVRMIPDAADPAKRKPLSTLSKAKQEEILRRPVRNAIILLHGHNEAERYGYQPAEVDAPWLMEYKRDVWTLLYAGFQTPYAAYSDCTAFYEYIYPSYRPVFEGGGEQLGASLARLIADDPTLKQLKSKYNLLFVAHSMGGLVARSAINQLSSAVALDFEKLVTWGSPHHGSPVVTMRYLLTSGYNLEVPNMCVTGSFMPLEAFNQVALYHGFVREEGAVDTPGERELRWDNSKPLNLEGIGWKRATWQEGDDATWDPARNKDLYNSKLADFNRTDKYYLSDKYVALYGITSSIAPIDLTSCTALVTFARAAAIAQGNGINHWLYNNTATLGSSYPNSPAVKESDGAVPVESMVGLGVFSAFNTYSLGNVDHEQYYGAPQKGKLTASDEGESTASWTFSKLKIKDAPNKQCDCPALELTGMQGSGTDKVVSGKLTWPGDAAPGKRASQIALVRMVSGTRTVTAASPFTIRDDGTFEATFSASLFEGNAEAPLVAAIIREGGEVSVPALSLLRLTMAYPGKATGSPQPAMTIEAGIEGERVKLLSQEGCCTAKVLVQGSGINVTFNLWFRIVQINPTGFFPSEKCEFSLCRRYEWVGFTKAVSSYGISVYGETKTITDINATLRWTGISIGQGVTEGIGWGFAPYFKMTYKEWDPNTGTVFCPSATCSGTPEDYYPFRIELVTKE